jgi:hypothetical protein
MRHPPVKLSASNLSSWSRSAGAQVAGLILSDPHAAILSVRERQDFVGEALPLAGSSLWHEHGEAPESGGHAAVRFPADFYRDHPGNAATSRANAWQAPSRVKLLHQHSACVLSGDVYYQLIRVRVRLQRPLDFAPDLGAHQLPGSRPRDLDVHRRALRLHRFSLCVRITPEAWADRPAA